MPTSIKGCLPWEGHTLSTCSIDAQEPLLKLLSMLTSERQTKPLIEELSIIVKTPT